MPRIYNPFLIVVNQSGSAGPSQGLQFIYLSSSYGDLTTSGSLGGITARDIQTNAIGAIGEIVISAPSNVTSSGKDIVRFFFTGSSGEEPRVGIGFEQNEPILRAFEVKSKVESSEGTEILIRSSRTGSGAQQGDDGGSINFVIDSSSFADITTTGSIARIKTKVNDVPSATQGVNGQLTFAISRGTDTEIDIQELAYGQGTYSDFYSTVTSHSIEIKDTNPQSTPTQNASFAHGNGTQLYTIIRTDDYVDITSSPGGLVQVNNKFGNGTIFLHGPTGEITASLVKTDDLVVSNSIQYNNVILESTESIINAGETVVGEFPLANYKALFIDYLISKDSNYRAGTITTAFNSNGTSSFTETSIDSVGDTSDASFIVSSSGTNLQLVITSSTAYTASISSRGILDGTNFALGGGVYSKSPFPFTGSAIITGSLDITGSIVPGGDGIYDLGDATHFWRTASIEHIVTLGETIEFRDPANKNTKRGTLKLDEQGGLKVRGSSDALTTISASHGHFTGDMRVAGDLSIRGISNVSASIAAIAGGGSVDTGSLVTTASVSSNTITLTRSDTSTITLTVDTGSTDTSALNTFTSSIQTEVNTLTAATSSYLTSIPSTYFNTDAYTTETANVNVNFNSIRNLVLIPTSSEGIIIEYRLSSVESGSRVGTFMCTHDGVNTSYNDITIPGVGIGSTPTLSAELTGSNININIENGGSFNFSGFIKKFDKLGAPIPLANPNLPTPLLDDYGGAFAAYSVRKLKASYSGYCMRVRRASDNSELDIGFDVNYGLDTSAIITHCGSSVGYVTIWYDQSGNDYHMSQSNASYQPTIYNGSSIYTAGNNSKPIVAMNATQRKYFEATFPSTALSNASIFVNALKPSGNNGIMMHLNGSYSDRIYTALNGSSNSDGTISGASGGTQYINNVQTSGLTWGEVYTQFNNNLTLASLINYNFGTGFTAMQLNSDDGYWGGYDFQEFIIYDSDQSTNRNNINIDINNYYGTHATGVLATYIGAKVAHSVRQLLSSANSSMRIRRDSDNTEQDIGFVNGNLDTGSIASFCGSNTGFVSIWYDQTGNGYHLSQSTADNQPYIYTSSAVYTVNNQPAVKFKNNYNGNTPDYLSTNNNLTWIGDSGMYFAIVARKDIHYPSNSGARHLWNAHGGSGNQSWGMGWNYASPAAFTITNVGSVDIISPSNNLNQVLISANYVSSSGTLEGFKNNSLINTITSSNVPSNPSVGSTLGARYGGGESWFDHSSQELIWFDSDKSGSRSDIETNINSYFNIY